MFLGVVREIKNNCPINGICEKVSENKLCIDFLDENGILKTIFVIKKFDVIPGDLVIIDYINNEWIIKEIKTLVRSRKCVLSVTEMLQLDRLIEQEKMKLNELKRMINTNDRSDINAHLFYDAIYREKILLMLSQTLDCELSDNEKRIAFVISK